MIVMDIPMPENCMICPCSYCILTGEYAGRWMCNAMEFKDNRGGFRKDLSEYFVVMEDHRPEGCPIRMGTK